MIIDHSTHTQNDIIEYSKHVYGINERMYVQRYDLSHSTEQCRNIVLHAYQQAWK